MADGASLDEDGVTVGAVGAVGAGGHRDWRAGVRYRLRCRGLLLFFFARKRHRRCGDKDDCTGDPDCNRSLSHVPSGTSFQQIVDSNIYVNGHSVAAQVSIFNSNQNGRERLATNLESTRTWITLAPRGAGRMVGTAKKVERTRGYATSSTKHRHPINPLRYRSTHRVIRRLSVARGLASCAEHGSPAPVPQGRSSR